MSDNLYLAHYGTKGMEWGKRLYQNKDGSLTTLGRIHYGVGEARKKAGEAIKNSPKTIGNAVKNAPKAVSSKAKETYRSLKSQRREAQKAQMKRSEAKKKERFEKEEARRQRNIEALRRRLIKVQSKKTLKEIESELSEERLNRARQKVANLLDKHDRIKEQAYLKQQEKMLKKDMKKAKRNAEIEAKKMLSRNNIKELTDEELNARMERIRKEIQLQGLEVERNIPVGMRVVGNALLEGTKQAAQSVTKDALTSLGKKAMDAMGLNEPVTPGDQAKRLQDILNMRKAEDAITEYEESADSRRATNLLNRRKAEDDLADYERSRVNKSFDDNLARAVKRATSFRTIEEARRSIEQREDSAEDAQKKQTTLTNKRKEAERRVKNYRSHDQSWEYIARQMNLTVDQVKDLYYSS